MEISGVGAVNYGCGYREMPSAAEERLARLYRMKWRLCWLPEMEPGVNSQEVACRR